jgi:hypothetical protein
MSTKVYDRTIEVLKSAVISAKLGSDERLDAIRRLDEQVRRLKPDFNSASEKATSMQWVTPAIFAVSTTAVAAGW